MFSPSSPGGPVEAQVPDLRHGRPLERDVSLHGGEHRAERGEEQRDASAGGVHGEWRGALRL